MLFINQIILVPCPEVLLYFRFPVVIPVGLFVIRQNTFTRMCLYLVFISDVPFDCCNLIIAVRHTTDKQRFLDEIFHNTFIQRIIHTFHLYQLINHACQHSDLLNIESHFMPP